MCKLGSFYDDPGSGVSIFYGFFERFSLRHGLNEPRANFFARLENHLIRKDFDSLKVGARGTDGDNF
jgi:hypothetical protein